MHIQDFDYELPPELIASHPMSHRSQSRLLCVNRESGEITHRYFYQILDELQPNDCLIVNNTKVIPARLFGRKESGGQVEILVERLIHTKEAWVHIRASKAPKKDTHILLDHDFVLRVEEKQEALYRVSLQESSRQDVDFLAMLEDIGHMPLPPYIERADALEDRETYQTVYAEVPGAVAAPTAGLHFDNELLTKIKEKGIQIGEVTLHVGAGTFQPVRVEDIRQHHMHSEFVIVPKDVCDLIVKTKTNGGRVIAIGTTVVRSLETAAQSGVLKPFSGETRIFIYPPYTFHVVDALVTNFHLPKSTLLMLVSAFAGRDVILNAYREAIREKYRFFSYGDAMWISIKKGAVS